METVRDVFTLYKTGLIRIYSWQEIEAITLLVLSDLLATSKAKLKAFPETEIAHQQQEQLQSILSELKTGRPIQYILGHTEFYGLRFDVNPSVLIPRPETEELVQWIIQLVQSSPTPIKAILDIGTGSGCIAIALKKHLPYIEVFAMDISKDALKIAHNNAEINGTDVNFMEVDILNFNYDTYLPDFDIIVSNPPYVTETDKKQMHQNVTDFEPHTALFVPEENPLLFYDAIANFAQRKLKANGSLFFEINENYGKETVELLRQKSFKNVELRQDMPGRDRMIRASK